MQSLEVSSPYVDELVSIIMPAYKAAAVIPESIQIRYQSNLSKMGITHNRRLLTGWHGGSRRGLVQTRRAHKAN